MEIINIRRSTRTYKEIKVENEKINKLLRAAMQAPSAFNQQAWEFIVIDEAEKLLIENIEKYLREGEKE